MQSFTYMGFNAQGRRFKGVVEATDVADARSKLKSRGLSVAELTTTEAHERQSSSMSLDLFKAKFNITRFFADLSVLMNAGLGIDHALRAIHEASAREADKQAIGSILDQLSSGATPSSALAGLKNIPEDAIALIASGERSARLPYVIKVVAADLERRDAHRKQLVDAAVYPAFLLVMVCVAVGIVTFVLVPTLEPIFESSGRSPPFIVAALSGLRHALIDPLPLVAALMGLSLLLLIGLLRPAAFKSVFSAMLLRTPLLGQAVRQSSLARYLQSLALLLENAVPLPEALALSARCCPTISFRDRLLSMREVVVSGKRLPEAFTATGLFSRGIVSLVAIGDEVNRLPAVLENASGVLRTDAQRMTDRLLALMTPAITILLGALVGGLVISVMTALLSVNELSVQ